MGIKLNFSNVLNKDNRFFYMGLAMIGVIGYHIYLNDIFLYDNSFKAFKVLFKYGYVGVDLFLFFSAFGLCYSYVNSSLKDFYKKRFIRIIPIYLIFKIIEFLIIREENVNQFLIDRFLVITSLSVIQTPYTCPGNLSLEWFIPAIINLYIIFPLLFRLIHALQKYSVWISLLFIIVTYWLSHLLWGHLVIHSLYLCRLPIIL